MLVRPWASPWAIADAQLFPPLSGWVREFDVFASGRDAQRAKILINLKSYRISLPSNNRTFNRKIALNHLLSQDIDEYRGLVSFCVHIRGFHENNERSQR
jgi:hypothetical protein